MEKLVVKGGARLVGTVKTSGAKNAVLPIIAASILGTTPSHLDEVPQLEDVHTISEVLKCLGLAVSGDTDIQKCTNHLENSFSRMGIHLVLHSIGAS